MSNNNPSNATLAAFSVGYHAVDATFNAASTAGRGTKNVAVATGHSVAGFFSGMKHAIAARRGTKVEVAKPEVDLEAKRRARQDLWDRVHGTKSEVAEVAVTKPRRASRTRSSSSVTEG